MARMKDLPDSLREQLEAEECPRFEFTPLVGGPPLGDRRVAVISTAGLHRRGDRPFTWGSVDYRVIPGDVVASDLVMSHISPLFDRSGFQNDTNVVLPIDRLRELEQEGFIGSVADYHYSFMGAVDSELLEPAARDLAPLLAADSVDAALLVPV
jgi:D-proline reductase (dithiol) PrdB